SLSPEYRAKIDSAISNSSGAATANQLTSQISAIQSQLSSLQSLSSQLANLNVSALPSGVALASGGSQQLVNGLTDYKSGLEAETGIPQLVDGISQYTAAVSQLTDGANAIVAKNDQLTGGASQLQDRKSTRLNSSHVSISYAVFCLKKKTSNNRS